MIILWNLWNILSCMLYLMADLCVCVLVNRSKFLRQLVGLQADTLNTDILPPEGFCINNVTQNKSVCH